MDKHEPLTNWYMLGSHTRTKNITTPEHHIRSDWPLISDRTVLISIISICTLLYGLYLGIFSPRNLLEATPAQQQAQQYLSAISQGDFVTAKQYCQQAENISQQIDYWKGNQIHNIRFESLERSQSSLGTLRTLRMHFTLQRAHGGLQNGTVVMNWLFPDLTWLGIPSAKTCIDTQIFAGNGI